MVSSLRADDDTYDSRVDVGREKQQQQKTVRMLCDENGSGKIVQHSCFIQTEKKRFGTLQSVSNHTLGPVHPRRRRGRGRGGVLLACDTFGVCVTERSLFCLLINTGSDLV